MYLWLNKLGVCLCFLYFTKKCAKHGHLTEEQSRHIEICLPNLLRSRGETLNFLRRASKVSPEGTVSSDDASRHISDPAQPR